MQFLVYLANAKDQPPSPPTPEGMAEMGRLMQEAMESGMVLSTGQLGGTASRVRLTGGQVSVTDGPFIEGKELVPGFTVIQVATRQQAIEWATSLRRCMGDGEIRVAQVNVPSAQ